MVWREVHSWDEGCPEPGDTDLLGISREQIFQGLKLNCVVPGGFPYSTLALGEA